MRLLVCSSFSANTAAASTKARMPRSMAVDELKRSGNRPAGAHDDHEEEQTPRRAPEDMPAPKSHGFGVGRGVADALLNQHLSILYVEILEILTDVCYDGVAAIAVELHDAFSALADLDPSVSGRLVTVLSKLFPVAVGLSDR